MKTTNFVMTEPDSHFYDDLKQIENTLEHMIGNEFITPNYMLTAIRNTIAKGYKMASPAPTLNKHDIVLFTIGRAKKPSVGQIRVIDKNGIYTVKRIDGKLFYFTDTSKLVKWLPKI